MSFDLHWSRIHWDFTINAVQAFQNTKKYYFGFTHAPLKFISAPQKDKHFIGQLWQLMTASNVGAWTQAWQAKWAVFKIEGFVCKRFLPFFPTPSPLFYLRHFSRGLRLLFLVLCSYKTAQKRLLHRLKKLLYIYYVYNTSSTPSSWCQGYWCEGWFRFCFT